MVQQLPSWIERSKASGFQVASHGSESKVFGSPSFSPRDVLDDAGHNIDGGSKEGHPNLRRFLVSEVERLHRFFVMKSYMISSLMRICMIYMFHLILNENCRNPLYIILEYMLFVAYLRIPCNMKMDPYCRDHSEIPTYTSNQPIYVLLAFFFPYSNVVQPLLRSSFGIESTCRRKCCCW